MQPGPLNSIYQEALQGDDICGPSISLRTRRSCLQHMGWSCVSRNDNCWIFVLVILKIEDFCPGYFWIHRSCKTVMLNNERLVQPDITSCETCTVGKHRNSIKKFETFLSYTRMPDNWHNFVFQKNSTCPPAASCMHRFILSILDFSLLIKAFKS